MAIRPPKPSGGKIIKTPSVGPVSTNRESPSFCLDHLISGFCISDCDQEQKAALADTLLSMSKRNWVDLMLAAKHGAGSEKISRTAINVAIPKAITDDVTFLVFRFWKKAPMIGFRSGRVFNIVWIDPKFAVYH
jgi:hypothetical protein